MQPLLYPRPAKATLLDAPVATPFLDCPRNTHRQRRTGLTRPNHADLALSRSVRDSRLVTCRHETLQRAPIWLTGAAVSGGLGGTV
jgi:hypothetical protein